MSQVAVKCQFCGDLFMIERPLLIDERTRATCPSCMEKARRNTERKRKQEGLEMDAHGWKRG